MKKSVINDRENAQIFNDIVDNIIDYMKCKEHEETLRQQARARLQVLLKAFTYQEDSNRIKFEKCMNQNFKERERIYKDCERLLDCAIENRDGEMAKIALNVIVNTYRENPMDRMDRNLINHSNLLQIK